MSWQRDLAGWLVRNEATREFKRTREDVAVVVAHTIAVTRTKDDASMPAGWPALGEVISVGCIDDDCTNDSADPWCRARVVERHAKGSIGGDGRDPYIVAEFVDHPGKAAVEDEGLTFQRLEPRVEHQEGAR